MVNGTAVISNVNGGNHSVEVIYSGDDKYAPVEVNATETVEGISIVAEDVVKFYHGQERLYVSVYDENGTALANKTVFITINGVEYSRNTDANGTASIAINIMPGEYVVKVESKEYNITQLVNVTVISTIISNDVVKTFRNDTQYWALFLDKEGKPLAKTDVKFNINGVFYTRTTNETGWARLNINLVPSEYVLTAYNPVTDEQKAYTITVLSRIESGNLTKYYRNESQFVVRVMNKDGSYVGAGETVQFNINGALYSRTTNETGHAKLSINLNPGKYVITTIYDGCVSGNEVEVLPTLITSDLSMNYRDGSKFIAKLVGGQGKAISGKNVQFNINGVLYNRETNAEGIARLNINLVTGQYIITSMYDTLQVANTIIIRD